MNEYMLVYKGGDPDFHKNTSPEEMGATMQRWAEWMGKLEAQGKLVTGGAPLHFGGKRMNKDKLVTDITASEFKELVSGYSIVKATTMEEAIELANDCPIFEAPNIEVEVREIMKLEPENI